MIFGDEKRFSKSLVSSPVDKQVQGVSHDATEAHIGPGAYFNTTVDEKRNGWLSRSFSRRPPMTPSAHESRADSYIGGVLTSYGALASPVSPKNRSQVGPGHYTGDVMNSFVKKVSGCSSMLSCIAWVIYFVCSLPYLCRPRAGWIRPRQLVLGRPPHPASLSTSRWW